MNFFTWFAIVAILLICLLWLYQHVIQPAFERKRVSKTIDDPQVNHALGLIKHLYQSVNAGKIAAAERKRLNWNHNEFVYGEMALTTFVSLLDLFEYDESGVFYDLGCGAGKIVLSASLLGQFKKVCGIELMPGLYQACERQRELFYQLVDKDPKIEPLNCQVEFIHASFLEVPFFEDASLVYVNSTAFFDKLWEELVNRLCELKSGAHVIVTSRHLPIKHFELVDDSMRLMSWGMNTVRVYRKI